MSKVFLSDVAVERRETCKGSKDGYPIVGLEHLTPEEITLTAWNEDSENTFTKMFRKGDILFGRRRAYLKKAAVAPFDGICSGDITVIQAKPDRILPELLPFIIQNDALFDFAVGKSAGSLSPRVKWEHLKNYEFELPEMDKQRELAGLLWAMDATRKSYQRLITATDELVKSQFIERFGDPITNPKGWPVMQLQDIVSDDCSISYGIVKPGDDVPDGVPVFRPVDIVGKKPEITELKRTSKAISDQYKRTLLTGRELLLTVRANIGDTCIIGDAFKGCNVGRGIVPIRVKEDLMSLEFLKCQMDFDTMHDYIQSLSKGITLIQLNMEDLRKIAFIVPPVDLQKEFLSIVCQSDKSKFELEQALSELTATYKRIITETFV